MNRVSSWGFTYLFRCIVLGTAYFATAALSLFLTRNVGGIATIWPASGLCLAVLALSAPRFWPGYLVSIAIAGIGANLLSGANILTAAIYTLANLSEALLAIALLYREEKHGISLFSIASLIRFAVAACVAGLLSATLATHLTGASTAFFLNWLSTVVLGTMVTTPLLLTLASVTARGRRMDLVRRNGREAAMIAVFVLTVSVATFAQTSYPILFLPLLTVFVAAYRLGPFGAAGSVMIVAIVGSVLVGRGYGPVQFVEGGEVAQLYFMQIYLLVLLVSALPMAALLNGRQRLIHELETKNVLLGQAESIAAFGHWRLDLRKNELFWSPEVYRIHGLPEGSPLSLENGLDAYHEDDRAHIQAAIDESLALQTPFHSEARIIRPDGEVRHVRSHGQSEFNEKGEAIAMFGVFRDVTEEVEARQQLMAARAKAEMAASDAIRLAHTDELTGLPNRRRTIAALNDALETARHDGQAMSVAIFDIDHFKQINDTFGHDIGDDIICRVARTAEGAVREGDMVGRFGGEEFVIVLPIADAAMAQRVAERVRDRIERAGLSDSSLPPATISVGVATMPADCDADMLLQKADAALYEAKKAGRNVLRLAA